MNRGKMEMKKQGVLKEITFENGPHLNEPLPLSSWQIILKLETTVEVGNTAGVRFAELKDYGRKFRSSSLNVPNGTITVPITEVNINTLRELVKEGTVELTQQTISALKRHTQKKSTTVQLQESEWGRSYGEHTTHKQYVPHREDTLNVSPTKNANPAVEEPSEVWSGPQKGSIFDSPIIASFPPSPSLSEQGEGLVYKTFPNAGGQVVLKGYNNPNISEYMRKHPGVKYNNKHFVIPPASISEVTLWCAKSNIPVQRELYETVTTLNIPLEKIPVSVLKRVPVSVLPSVTPQRAKKFTAMGIVTLYDLISTSPRRYIDRTHSVPIAHIREGEEVGLVVKVTSVTPNHSRKFLRIVVADTTGNMTLTFFHSMWMSKKFTVGDEVFVHGKPERWKPSSPLSMTNPIIEHYQETTLPVVPIYPQSGKNGVTSTEVQRALRETAVIFDKIDDPLSRFPSQLSDHAPTISKGEAFHLTHFPPQYSATFVAKNKLAFDELLEIQVSLLKEKKLRNDEEGFSLPETHLSDDYIRTLPYPLTGSQEETINEIRKNMSEAKPMHRLLQGDVGAGKAQPLTSKVLTTSGFKNMGDVCIGETLINPDGGHSEVVGIFPQGIRERFVVTFSDGTTTVTDENHLWLTHTTTQPRTVINPYGKVDTLNESVATAGNVSQAFIAQPASDFADFVTTGEMMKTMNDDGNCYDFFVPTPHPKNLIFPNPSEASEDDLTAAYRLGCSVYISEQNPDECKIPKKWEEVEKFSPEERAMVLKGIYDVTKTRPLTTVTPVEGFTLLTFAFTHKDTSVVEKKGNTFAMEHFVPLTGGVLLGKEKTENNTIYTFLMRSTVEKFLLGTVNVAVETFMSEKLGKGGEGNFFGTQVLGKKVLSIERCGFEHMQCIKVSHPNGLYITDGYNVTHNTTVAISALLTAVGSGHQAALMAPTEILARQLYNDVVQACRKIEKQLGTKIRVEFFSNQLKGKVREETLTALRAGDINIAVGTHALLTEDVNFNNLALVVIDEQHRFGVEQRNVLKEKAHHTTPDTLVMTATPIPRTAIMTVFGDLDVSILKDMPPGRKPVKTVWIDEEPNLANPDASPWRAVEEEIQKGHQVFIVCPLVEESETLTVTSAVETYETLKRGALREYSVGLVHGQQKPAEKEETMKQFQRNNINILISTTVIEVGVNIPNATLIVILDPNRFGVSQLHQLRGRVGRSEHPSRCILYGLGKTPESRERLTALTETNDGFKLSEVDLKLRGHGSLFGAQQSGVSDLKFADIRKNNTTLIEAKKFAEELFHNTHDVNVLNFITEEHLTEETLEWLNKS